MCKYSEHVHTHSIAMSIFERLSRFDFKIYEVGHQELSLSTETSPPIEKIISYKCNTHVKSKI
jgi:hypothetical protein